MVQKSIAKYKRKTYTKGINMFCYVSVKNAIERNKEAGNPVCGFDTVLKKSYILYPDGTKEYA